MATTERKETETLKEYRFLTTDGCIVTIAATSEADAYAKMYKYLHGDER